MIKEVVSIYYEFRVVIRIKLECGHLASTVATGKQGIKKRYICHACKNKEERKQLH